MVAEQAAQIKKLEGIFAGYNKDMKTEQAQAAVATSKEVAADKTLKTKADRDRRLKEKNENNTGRFIKERKMEAVRQGKYKDKCIKEHENQLVALSKDIKLTIEYYEL